jgi:hypothetical protein
VAVHLPPATGWVFANSNPGGGSVYGPLRSLPNATPRASSCGAAARDGVPPRRSRRMASLNVANSMLLNVHARYDISSSSSSSVETAPCGYANENIRSAAARFRAASGQNGPLLSASRIAASPGPGRRCSRPRRSSSSEVAHALFAFTFGAAMRKSRCPRASSPRSVSTTTLSPVSLTEIGWRASYTRPTAAGMRSRGMPVASVQSVEIESPRLLYAFGLSG